MSYVPHSDADRRAMLAAIGVSSVRELFADIPAAVVHDGPLDLPEALSEWEAIRLVAGHASRNAELACFAGAGIYDHHVPAAADHLVRRSEFYTAYTPYQPEVSQGTLQAIYEFQTMVCELTGMDVANASMYDGATAAAEAVLMAISATRRRQVVLAGHLHPYYRQVVTTYTQGLDIEIRTAGAGLEGVVDPGGLEEIGGETACVVVQNPNFLGDLKREGI
jgi:glycine dehydrogenase subunit 1